MDFKIGDQIWWFQAKERLSMYQLSKISPDTITLVHDVVTDIVEDLLVCWHGTHNPKEIWGKSRKEAWDRLKNELEKWGSLD
jgi:hypothetical protein